jgi:hypothetical protein
MRHPDFDWCPGCYREKREAEKAQARELLWAAAERASAEGRGVAGPWIELENAAMRFAKEFGERR